MSDKKTTVYGGQAVMEGVMMRGTAHYAMAVRKPNGEIHVVKRAIKNHANKRPWLKWPIIRGIAAFGSSLSMGMKILTESAEIATEGEEAEPTTRFEQFLLDKFGDKMNDVLMTVSMVVAVGIAVLLFVLLPLWIGSGLSILVDGQFRFLGLIEGIARLLIFLAYIWLISRSKDIQRFFQYHGAEHKVINGYEQGAVFAADVMQKFSRLHNRCGTSFLLIVMVISILVFSFVNTPDIWTRILSRLLLIPVVAGISYEVIQWAGRSQSNFVKIVSFPGLCLQRMTTKEPDVQQVEVALIALQAVMEKEAEDNGAELKPENEPSTESADEPEAESSTEPRDESNAE